MYHEREVHRIEEMSCDNLVSVNVGKFKVKIYTDL